MDITQLRYFLAAAELLNYTKAAGKVYLSRQALRQALGTMEKELGTPLFINERNKLSLTVQGEYLQSSGRAVVNAFDEMMEGIRCFSGGKSALKAGFSVSLFPFMLPETDGILQRFRQKYPQIGLEVSNMTNDEALEAVEKGQIDCATVVQMPKRREGMEFLELAHYDVLISYGEKYCQKYEGVATIEQLEGVPCIGMGSLEQTMRPVYEACRQRGITLDYEAVPGSIDAFYRISHGQAVGFDIEKRDIPKLDNVYASRLDGYFWEIGILYRKDSPQNRAIRFFASFMKETYECMKEKQQQTGMSPLVTV